MSEGKPTAGRGLKRSLLRRWPRYRAPVLVVLAVASALVSTGAVWGLNVFLTVGQGLRERQTDVEGLDPGSDFASRPRNVLILGSDTRAGLTPEEQAAFGTEETVGGERSDTIILMHVDPRREEAVVVHFPRDLLVDIPGHGQDRINAAYSLGGPSLTVRTVKRFTGLPIHNFVEVGLAGFQDLVDTLGGVRMCVDRPMFDELAGLAIPRAGCYTFDGSTALAFVRARHIEGDLIPDFSRITRQQQFMRAMMNRVLSVRALLDEKVIREAVGAVTTDSGLSTADVLSLGSKLRELAEEDPSGASSLDFRVVPSVPQTIDGVAYVVAQHPATDRLFEALAEGEPLGRLGEAPANTRISPAVIKVAIVGSGEAAEDAAAFLKRAGFIVLGIRPGAAATTSILYAPGRADRASVVSGYVSGLEPVEAPPSLLGGAEVALVVGSDYDSVRP